MLRTRVGRRSAHNDEGDLVRGRRTSHLPVDIVEEAIGASEAQVVGPLHLRELELRYNCSSSSSGGGYCCCGGGVDGSSTDNCCLKTDC